MRMSIRVLPLLDQPDLNLPRIPRQPAGKMMNGEDGSAVSGDFPTRSSSKQTGSTTSAPDKEQRLLAQVTSRSGGQESEPPNGGLQGWLQVLAAFFMFFNSWGLVNTFGEYSRNVPFSLQESY